MQNKNQSKWQIRFLAFHLRLLRTVYVPFCSVGSYFGIFCSIPRLVLVPSCHLSEGWRRISLHTSGGGVFGKCSEWPTSMVARLPLSHFLVTTLTIVEAIPGTNWSRSVGKTEQLKLQFLEGKSWPFIVSSSVVLTQELARKKGISTRVTFEKGLFSMIDELHRLSLYCWLNNRIWWSTVKIKRTLCYLAHWTKRYTENAKREFIIPILSVFADSSPNSSNWLCINKYVAC